MEESILQTVKATIGITSDQTHFDSEILMHINSIIAKLNQIGIGPTEGFRVEDESSDWSSFIGDDPNLDMVKDYISISVKLAFDPPSNSFAIDSLRKITDEYEWRLSVKATESEVIYGV